MPCDKPAEMSRETRDLKATHGKFNSAHNHSSASSPHRANGGPWPQRAAGPAATGARKSPKAARTGPAAAVDGHPADTPNRPASAMSGQHGLTAGAGGSGARPSSTLPLKACRQPQQQPPPARPSPVVRSASTPLRRSVSLRVSKKERRWSERLANPKTPVATTYQDDYQSPENLSQQLCSLDLESSGTLCVSNPTKAIPSHTTYRDSFQWPDEMPGPTAIQTMKGQTASNPKNDYGSVFLLPKTGSLEACRYQQTKNSTAHKGESLSGSANTFSEGKMTASASVGKSVVSVNVETPSRNGTTAAQTNSQMLKIRVNGVSNSTVENRKSSASSNEDSPRFIESKQVVTSSLKGSVKTEPGSPLPFSGVNAAPKVINNHGQNGGGVNKITETQLAGKSEASKAQLRSSLGFPGFTFGQDSVEVMSTPRRTRPNHQLQSSGGSSPFPYGSDSGY